jgi:phosphatidylserine/phosphatidylglycerophosphate/cardiolipin synthase-like enzyme
MDVSELDRFLNDAIADRSLQSAERKALIEWIAHNAADEQSRAFARSRAFEAARTAATLESLPIIEWLEDVVRVLCRSPQSDSSGESAHAYFSPGTTCIQEVIRQFDIARQTCDVCVFTITDDRITKAIIRAHQRGVNLRIITDDEKSHDLGSDIEQLKAVGIPCKMDIGQPAHMHHKFALFDGKRLMSGSFNWTRSASEQNEENLIVTPDQTLVAAFSARFEMLWRRM